MGPVANQKVIVNRGGLGEIKIREHGDVMTEAEMRVKLWVQKGQRAEQKSKEMSGFSLQESQKESAQPTHNCPSEMAFGLLTSKKL